MDRTSRYRLTVTQALADTIVEEFVTRRTTKGSQPRRILDRDALPKVGDVVGGLYRLVRPLGQGVFGMVYVAERLDVPEHRVALKVMLKDVTEDRNIERELVMLAAAGHPNVVQLKDHGVTSRYVWFTMPMYEGETLEQALERRTLDLREAYEVFLPVARGVEALHHAGLRHQDLKPENIFLARFAGRLHPIILDLGVAAEKDSAFVAGTVLFAAPEQSAALLGQEPEQPMSAKVDTYSLAATLLLSLVGWEHFPGANAGDEEEMRQAQEQRATHPLDDDALPELTGEPRRKLEDAFRKWFALDPRERPDMGQMAEQLDVLLEQERERHRQEQLQRAKQRAKLQRARIAVAALLLLGGAGLWIAYANRRTLTLARELERARKFGADSFDKLETCIAANRLTRMSLQRCHKQREADETEFKTAMAKLTRSGNQQQRELVAQLTDTLTKLRKCRDDAEEAATTCEQQKQQLTEQCKSAKDELSEQVSKANQQLEQTQEELQRTQDRLQQCLSEQQNEEQPSEYKDTPYDDVPGAGDDTSAVPVGSSSPSHASDPVHASPATSSPPSSSSATAPAPPLSSPVPASSIP